MRTLALLLAFSLLATGLASSQPYDTGTGGTSTTGGTTGGTTTGTGGNDTAPGGTTGTQAGLTGMQRAQSRGLFADFTTTGAEVAGLWVKFRWDGASGSVLDYDVNLAGPNAGATAGGQGGGGPTVGGTTGTAANTTYAEVFDWVDLEPWDPNAPGTAQAATPIVSSGLWKFEGGTAMVMVHNTPAAELHVLALQDLNVSFQPATGITFSMPTTAQDGRIGVSGNGVDGRILLMGGATMNPNAFASPPPGATGTSGAQPVTVSLPRGGQVLFLLRAQGLAGSDFESESTAIGRGAVGAIVRIAGEGATFAAHSTDLGVVVAPQTVGADRIVLRVDDRRDTLGICAMGPGQGAGAGTGGAGGGTGTPGGTNATGGADGTDTTGGGTGATAAAPCTTFVVLLRLDVGALASNVNLVRVTIDEQVAMRGASHNAVFAQGRMAATGTVGGGSAPSGTGTQPGTTTTSGSTGGNETTQSGGPGTTQGTGNTSGTQAGAASGLAFFAAVMPGMPNVLQVSVVMPPGDHNLVVASAAPAAPPGRTPTPTTPPAEEQPRTPPVEAGVAVAAVALTALAFRRKDE